MKWVVELTLEVNDDEYFLAGDAEEQRAYMLARDVTRILQDSWLFADSDYHDGFVESGSVTARKAKQ